MISVSDLAMAFGERTLFSGASFQLNPGERYGLVGANGSGKTTLLRILAGDEEPTGGSVSVPKSARVGVLRQDQFLYEDEPILRVAIMGNRELWKAVKEKEALLEEAEDRFDADRFARLEETVQRHDGYAAEARAAAILEGLGIPAEEHQEPLRTLSGGFKLRVLLGQVLASDPDVLLLDEPTNHLDILSIRWLEGFLSDFSGPLVVISHDQRFLDTVCTHILDVDYQTVELYTGNYSTFVEAKKEERERREKEIAGKEREIAHHQRFVERFRAKATKARQAQSKLRLIERKAEDMEDLPESSRRYPTFRFETRRHSGKEVLKARGVRKAFGENQVLHGVDLDVHRGDRLAIMGPNGIGKSTLLKIVTGNLEADAGQVEWGYETHPGYFAQDYKDQFGDAEMTAQEWLWRACPDRDLGFVRSHLGRVLFTDDEPHKSLQSLSGGEAARLVFAKLALEKPNVLVLDEPTNHLDLESIEALVEGLEAFEGTLILVSHDRWFVSRLATRIVDLRADGMVDYPGTYDEYVAARGTDRLDRDQVVRRAKEEKRRPKGDQGDRRKKERRSSRRNPQSRAREERERNARRLKERQEELAAEIDRKEERTQEIDTLFCRPGYYEDTPPEEIRALEEERDRLQGEVEDLLARWEAAAQELYELQED